MSHSGYILSELSQPSPLNMMFFQQCVISAAKEAGKTEDEYLKYVESEMKFKIVNKIVYKRVPFYVFGRI